MSGQNETPLAQNLRRIRRQRGISVVELARRAGTSRATLTQLESGSGNPTLDTLYALANGLDASLADLIAAPSPPAAPRVVPAGTGTRVVGAAVEAWLLDTITDRVTATEIYDFRLHTGAAQHSAAHPIGTREHLHVHSGRIRVGPADAPVDLAAGDFVTFDATREHVYHRIGRAEVRGLLIISHAEH